jgi:hypothetical protein
MMAILFVALAAGCETSGPAGGEMGLAAGVTPDDLAGRVAKFEPAVLDFDDSALAPWEKTVVEKLVQATDLMHELFSEQVSPENATWKQELAVYDGPGAEAARTYFDIMVGPWDRLEHDQPFLSVGEKPAGAGYYPADMTKQEFDDWIAAHPEDRDAFTAYFTVIRRGESGEGLQSVPYNEAYGEKLGQAAALLREAADASQNATLSDFLRKRAAAFLSNDYYESDVAWMDIADSRIEPTIGPYEVYEDGLFGYKAAFESFLTVADEAASAELQRLKDYLPDLERQLPIEDRYKNPDRGFESPIRVVDEIYAGGDTRAGVQTTAFNLPNDARVVEEKGSKKVMLRNVSQAKFDKILMPIASSLLTQDLVAQISFQPWFTNVVMHELAHGLGPTTVTTPAGETMQVNRALRDTYSALEELKADVTGLHNMTVLEARGVFDDQFVRAAFAGHIADLLRAVRFGASEAHGKANLIQFNWLREKGALKPAIGDETETAPGSLQEDVLVTADLDAVRAANRELATEVLMIEATGDYDRANAFLAQYGTVSEELSGLLGRLDGKVPVDIRPVYAVLDKMAGWH